MPLFDFKCRNCSNIEEKLLKRTPFAANEEREELECSQCGSKNLDKLPSSPSFHLKGDGWAKDGYSSPSIKKMDE